jgi:putative flippase GtrA
LAGALYQISAGGWILVCLVVWYAVHLLSVARKTLVFVAAAGVVAQTRLALHGKGSALRNAIAALVATGVDFCVFSVLIALGAWLPPVATFMGAAIGGLVNFVLNKTWTFSASGSTSTMARRYVTVSATSALLNSAVVLVLMWLPLPHATLAWLIARGLVFLGWNFPLQRDYVFSHRDPVA